MLKTEHPLHQYPQLSLRRKDRCQPIPVPMQAINIEKGPLDTVQLLLLWPLFKRIDKRIMK